MNARLFTALRDLSMQEGLDRFFEPGLPPLDMAEDTLRPIAEALAALARSLGMDAGVSICLPLFSEARSNTQLELQLLNVQFALMRAMLLLGYDWPRMEDGMRRLIAQGGISINQKPASTNP